MYQPDNKQEKIMSKIYHQKSNLPFAVGGVIAISLTDAQYEQIKGKAEFLAPASAEVQAYLKAADKTVAPVSVTMAQARKALHRAGLLDKVSAGIKAMPKEAQIDWEFATRVHRDSSLVAAVGAGIGLEAADLDALFVAAVAL